MQPLEGYKILEMGTFGPATLAAGLLADLGMEIIRIEPPPHRSRPTTDNKDIDGDLIPIPPGGVPWQRNKQSIVLNLKMPEAKEIFYRLGNIGNPNMECPCVPDVMVAETKAALYAAVGILTALLARNKTGQGQYLDVCLYEIFRNPRAHSSFGP